MQSDWLFILDEKCAIGNFNVYILAEVVKIHINYIYVM